jgi:hypothetical protein
MVDERFTDDLPLCALGPLQATTAGGSRRLSTAPTSWKPGGGLENTAALLSTRLPSTSRPTSGG